MSKFIEHVAVHNGFNNVWFAPGDEVPEWALDKVGSHVLDGDAEGKSDEPAETPNAEPDANPETGEQDKAEGKADEPDFTKPAEPKKRTTARKKV